MGNIYTTSVGFNFSLWVKLIHLVHLTRKNCVEAEKISSTPDIFETQTRFKSKANIAEKWNICKSKHIKTLPIKYIAIFRLHTYLKRCICFITELTICMYIIHYVCAKNCYEKTFLARRNSKMKKKYVHPNNPSNVWKLTCFSLVNICGLRYCDPTVDKTKNK